MIVADVTSVTNSSAGTRNSLTGPGGSLGKDAFMNLLVTQLRYQDPLAPMVWLPEQGEVDLHYALASAAQVTVEVLDASGRVVRTLQLGSQSAGDNAITWDGENDAGQRLASGAYSFRVTAVDDGGAQVTATPYTVGRVTGVRFSGGSARLLLDGLEVSPSDLVMLR